MAIAFSFRASLRGFVVFSCCGWMGLKVSGSASVFIENGTMVG